MAIYDFTHKISQVKADYEKLYFLVGTVCIKSIFAQIIFVSRIYFVNIYVFELVLGFKQVIVFKLNESNYQY